MKIMKRSQIAIISLSLMVMVAGYINYKYNPEREENLGKSVYVNSKDGFIYSNVSIYEDKEEKAGKTDEEKANNLYKQKEAKETLSTFRANRNDMFSELKETYSKAVLANSSNVEKQEEYQKKLNELIKNKHTITVVEELIKSKGIDDIVIVPTNDNLNVIVADKEKISKEQIVMIQKVIQDELKFPADKITISVP